VLDFYCPEARLCVELDGSAHDHRYDYDERRTAYLAQQGIRVIRFTNDQVFTCLEGVVAQILRAAAPHPCRGGVPVGRGGGQ
jgi:adenine-specific DNA-methyltransferase